MPSAPGSPISPLPPSRLGGEEPEGSTAAAAGGGRGPAGRAGGGRRSRPLGGQKDLIPPQPPLGLAPTLFSYLVSHSSLPAVSHLAVACLLLA